MKSRSLKERLEEKFVRDASGCWLWTRSLTPLGYGQIADPPIKSKPAHRAAWEVYRGAIPEGMHVLHRCDVRRCVNPDHLYLGTHQDNMRDRTDRQRGYAPPSEKAPHAKLTWKKVCEIRLLISQGWKNVWLAREFGVEKRAISDIRRGATWKVPPGPSL